MVESQGKVSEKTGNFEKDIEWQPCLFLEPVFREPQLPSLTKEEAPYMGRSRGWGDRGPGPPGLLAILVKLPRKITKLPTIIQCFAIIGPPGKHHLNGVSLAGQMMARK